MKKNIYMYITESLCCVVEANTTLYIIYTLINFFKKRKLFRSKKKIIEKVKGSKANFHLKINPAT